MVPRGASYSKGGSIFNKERDRYRPGVIVNFNEKAWDNETLFLEWITQALIPIMHRTDIDQILVANDCVSSPSYRSIKRQSF